MLACAQQPLDVGAFCQRPIAQAGAIPPYHQRFGEHALGGQLASTASIAGGQTVDPLAAALLLQQSLVELYRLPIVVLGKCLLGQGVRRKRLGDGRLTGARSRGSLLAGHGRRLSAE